jgi:HSP20 family protein
MGKDITENELLRTFEGNRPILFSCDTSFSPPTDVWETVDEIFIVMEIGGLNSRDFEINYSGGYLIVKGHRREKENLVHSSIVKFHKKEIDYGEFQVKIKMNNRIRESGISAKYLDGILAIILAKDTQSPKLESIQIPVDKE